MSESKSENKNETVNKELQKIFDRFREDCKSAKEVYSSVLDNRYISRLVGNYAPVDVCFDLVHDNYNIDVTELFLGAIEKDRVDVIYDLTQRQNEPDLMKECLEYAREKCCCDDMITVLKLAQE